MAGDGEDLPAVEIVSDSGVDAIDAPARQWGGGHEVVRTLAAVVTAAAVVWGASALHGSRAADERTACLSELNMTMFVPAEFGPGRTDTSDRRALIETAIEECDFILVPEAMESVDDG